MNIPVDVHVRMTGEQYARYQALLEAFRNQQNKASQVELLLAGLEQLALAAGKPADRGDDRTGDDDTSEDVATGESAAGEAKKSTRVNSRSPYQVIVQQCPDCGTARIATNRGEKKLTPQELRTILCDANRRRPGKKNQAAVPERLRRAVLERDRFQCRAAGCNGTGFLAVHHLVPRERGGANVPDNLITLCSGCHRAAHEADHRVRAG